MQAERHALEACVLEMAGKSAALERWLADNEKKAVTGEYCCPHHVIGLWLLAQGRQLAVAARHALAAD